MIVCVMSVCVRVRVKRVCAMRMDVMRERVS